MFPVKSNTAVTPRRGDDTMQYYLHIYPIDNPKGRERHDECTTRIATNRYAPDVIGNNQFKHSERLSKQHIKKIVGKTY